MILIISFPDKLRTEAILEQANIPCFVRKGKGDAELWFDEPLQVARGTLKGWDRRAVEERVPAGAGGEFTYYSYAQVTLQRVDVEEYEIVSMKIFDEERGWCQLIDGSRFVDEWLI